MRYNSIGTFGYDAKAWLLRPLVRWELQLKSILGSHCSPAAGREWRNTRHTKMHAVMYSSRSAHLWPERSRRDQSSSCKENLFTSPHNPMKTLCRRRRAGYLVNGLLQKYHRRTTPGKLKNYSTRYTRNSTTRAL